MLMGVLVVVIVVGGVVLVVVVVGCCCGGLVLVLVVVVVMAVVAVPVVGVCLSYYGCCCCCFPLAWRALPENTLRVFVNKIYCNSQQRSGHAISTISTSERLLHIYTHIYTHHIYIYISCMGTNPNNMKGCHKCY